MKLYLNKTLDKYDFKARVIANCLYPTKKRPLIPIEVKFFLLGCGIGWLLGICFLGLLLTGG